MLLGSVSVFVVWLIYRKQIIDERKRILNSIDALLQLSGEWFDAEYTKNYENQQWYSPRYSVIPVDISQVPGILTSNLLQESISKYLSFFIQLVRRFNHCIETFNDFLHSDPTLYEKACSFYQNDFKNLSYQEVFIKVASQPEPLRSYLEQLYLLQKQIHCDGIGRGSLDDKIPSLSLCFKKLRHLVQLETKKASGFFSGNLLWKLADFIFLLIPLCMVALFFINIIENHLVIIFY